MANSVGLIESKGLVALIEAADVILKNSPVKILGIHKLENGLVSLAVSGNNEYVKAAVDSGSEAGKRVGEIYSSTVIDNPSKDLLKLFSELFYDFNDETETELPQGSVTKVKTEEIKKEEVAKEISNVKPIIKSDFKREKSKPLAVTKNDPLKKIKQSEQRKSNKANPDYENTGTEKSDNINKVVSKKPDDEIISPISTIERLRLEALGINKKADEVIANNNGETLDTEKLDKINVALDSKDIDFSAIDNMNVHKLRNYARKFPDFPIKGREISRANRNELIKLFKTLNSQ